jgi:hypothetical protein
MAETWAEISGENHGETRAEARSVDGPTETRLQLLRAGYSPLPLFGKEPPNGKNNSRRGLNGWTKLGQITPQMIAEWARTWPDAANTGVLTADMPTLDIDIHIERAAVAAENLARGRFEELGYFPVRIGKPPKRAIPFRTDEPFKKITADLIAPNGKGERIEFLANGQQVVVNGIHPDTQRPYEWHGGEPGQIPRADLPYIRESEARKLVEDIVELLVRDFGYRLKSAPVDTPPKAAAAHPRASAGDGEPPTYDEVAAALAFVPNDDLPYDGWVRIGMALKASLGEAGRAPWEEWSARSSKNRPAETARKWTHDFRNVTQLSARTIFFEAQQNGWINPRGRAAIEAEASRVEAAMAKANAEADHDDIVAMIAGAAEADHDDGAARQDPGRQGRANANNANGAAQADAKPNGGAANRLASPPRKAPELIRAVDVVSRPKDWLWKGHLLRSAIELLAGEPGLGKSQLQCSLVACATTGKPWPDGAPGGEPTNVIMLTTEDCLDQEVVPRLIAAGSDLQRITFLKCIRQGGKRDTFLLAEHIELLHKAATEHRAGFITIDPITAHLGAIDGHKATEVRSQLAPLADLAEQLNAAISTVTHPPKNASSKAINHFIGSQAFIAAARIGHLCVNEVKRNEDGEVEETGRVLFTNAKNNPHRIMPTLAYRIEEIVVDQDGARTNIAAPRVVWCPGTVNISANAAVAAATGAGGGPKGGDRDAAIRKFLLHAVSEGPVSANKLYERGEVQGFSEDRLKRVKENCGIEAFKDGTGPWAWRLVGDQRGTQLDLPIDKAEEVLA